MQLTQLQRSLQSHIVAGSTGIQDWVVQTGKVPAATRLRIYSDAYRLRLIDALRENYPTLHAALGDDDFSHMGNRYLDAHPSSFKSIRWFGGQLPEWLNAHHAEHRWLEELARWEWAIGLAFDAADTVPMTLDDLGAVAAEEFPTLTFALHPGVQRIRLATNVVQLYRARTDDAPMPTPISSDATDWLIWRQDLATRYRSLTDDESAALAVVATGGTFEQICERLCDWHALDARGLASRTRT